MPIHFRENRYPGINAHLNNALQQPHGDWMSFHNRHIIYLTDALTTLLPSNYFARNEKSLQIVSIEEMQAGLSPVTQYPDITIYEDDLRGMGGAAVATATATTATPMQTLPLIDYELDTPITDSVLISYAEANALIPVTRIELFSPTNKPLNPHYYRNRTKTLMSGVHLVELDYLNLFPPAYHFLKPYLQTSPNAFPYTVLITIPYPSYEKGRIEIYGFGILDPLPALRIPLLRQDFVRLDLNAVYQQTFAADPFYGLRLVDYDQLPLQFEAFPPHDQAAIRAFLTSIVPPQNPAP